MRGDGSQIRGGRWSHSLRSLSLLAAAWSAGRKGSGSADAFPPGADAGWSYIGGPWFFSADCRNPSCDDTLPFEPARGAAGDKITLYNRNTYRDFQTMFEFRHSGVDAGSSVGFVFGHTAHTKGSFLALEFPFAANNVSLSRYQPDGTRKILANASLPYGGPHETGWHTVVLNVSGMPGNCSAPATVRAWFDGNPLPPFIDGAVRPNDKPLGLPELADYGFVGFIASSREDGAMSPRFWLDPSDFLNTSKDSPPAFVPLDLSTTVATRRAAWVSGSSASSDQQLPISSKPEARIKPMSVMTFWSGGGSPCIRTKDEYVCHDYAADLRDQADWVTMRGLRDNDKQDANLNGSAYMFNRTGLSGFVTFRELWDGALWPYCSDQHS